MSDTSATGTGAEHTQGETKPWKVWVDGHLQRKDSADFTKAKTVAHQINHTLFPPQFLTEDMLAGAQTQIQMHHGGSIYLHDDDGWFLCKNLAGIEWSSQFCADPAKADLLRQNVARLVKAFPKTVPQLVALGYTDIQEIIDTPITTAELIARWTDCIFNSCVPLPEARHIGSLPTGDGVHHYPTPITDIDLIKHADFTLWVTDPVSKTPVAVVPRSPRDSGDGSVSVIHAEPGTPLHADKAAAKARNEDLVLPADHPIAKAAFALQPAAAPIQ